VLVVFAKQPRPGFVKTRMSPAISEDDAAGLYREMLLDVLAESERACQALRLPGVLTVAPPTAGPELANLAPEGFRVVAQRGSGLGERMEYEVSRAFASGAKRVVLRGSDNPALAAAEISGLFEALDSVDVAISPDLDGGYGAIGLRRSSPGIFDHEMSTASVLDETVRNLEAAGLTVELGPVSFDLDTIEDIRHLTEVRETLPRERCPRTLGYLDRLDL
jgi:rSAM/selenodomain-associated transferase 1